MGLVPTNGRALNACRCHVTDLRRRSLRRRRQKDLPQPASFIPGLRPASPSNARGGRPSARIGRSKSPRIVDLTSPARKSSKLQNSLFFSLVTGKCRPGPAPGPSRASRNDGSIGLSSNCDDAPKKDAQKNDAHASCLRYLLPCGVRITRRERANGTLVLDFWRGRQQLQLRLGWSVPRISVGSRRILHAGGAVAGRQFSDRSQELG
jgi:hypothetical protein